MSKRSIDRNFDYHETNEEQKTRMKQVTDVAKIMASVIEEYLPDNTREKALALTNLEQAKMWAVSSIAKEEAYEIKRLSDIEAKRAKRKAKRKEKQALKNSQNSEKLS